MEAHQTTTSPDGSRNRNTPERCPRPLYLQDSTQETQEIPQEHQEIPQEHHEIPQTRPLYSQDSTQEHQEISQACPMYLQDSTQEHQEIPQASPLYSWDSSQEGGSDYRKHLNIVMVESHFEGEDLVDTRQDEPGGNALWKHPKSGHSKESQAEEEVIEGGTPGARSVFIRSETKEQEVVVIGEEEEDTDFIPVDLQRKTSQNYGAADGTNFEDRLSGRKSEDVSGWDTNPVVSPEVLTIAPQAMGGDKPFPCGECGLFFKHKSSLILHQHIHSGKKPYSCSECGKQFAQKANYLRHQRLHMGEKQYKCTECAQKQCLVLQQKLYAEIGPFSCSACGANFIREPQSVTQKKTHKGMRHFTCPDCGDVFMLRSSLVIHQKVHSAENGSRLVFKENSV